MAGVVGFIVAVALLVEDVQRAAFGQFGQGEHHRSRGLVRRLQSAVVGVGAGAVHHQGGDVFVRARRRAAVIERDDVARAMQVLDGEPVAAAVFEGQLPFVAAVIANGADLAVRLPAGCGGAEKDGAAVQVEGGAGRMFEIRLQSANVAIRRIDNAHVGRPFRVGRAQPKMVAHMRDD